METRAEKVCFHGCMAEVQSIRGFTDRQLFDISQNENNSQRGVQATQTTEQNLPKFLRIIEVLKVRWPCREVSRKTLAIARESEAG